MKYRKAIAMLIAGATMMFCACGPSPEKIQQNVDSAMKINHDIDSAYQVLNYSFESYMPANMDAALEGLKKYINEADKRLDAVDVPSQDLEKALRDKISVIRELALKECAEQVRLYKISEVEFTETNRSEWDEYAKSAAQKLNGANAKVNDAYSKISKKQ